MRSVPNNTTWSLEEYCFYFSGCVIKTPPGYFSADVTAPSTLSPKYIFLIHVFCELLEVHIFKLKKVNFQMHQYIG